MSTNLQMQTVAKDEEIICESLHVSSDVCSDSIIDAIYLHVEGSTEIDSKQFIKKANIHMHQGNLRCHEALVTLLDGGEIHATNVNVDTCISGTIYAQNVIIKHLTSNVKVYASNSIQIEYISGSDNQLIIDYKEIPILISKIELIQDDIKELGHALQKAKEHNSSSEKNIINEISRLNKELDEIQHSVENATISIEKKLNGTNIICFIIDDKNSLSFTAQKEQYKPFSLHFESSTVTLLPTQEKITLKA